MNAKNSASFASNAFEKPSIVQQQYCFHVCNSMKAKIFQFFSFSSISPLFNSLQSLVFFFFFFIYTYARLERTKLSSFDEFEMCSETKWFCMEFHVEKNNQIQLWVSNKEQRKCRSISLQPELNMTGDSWFRSNWFKEKRKQKAKKKIDGKHIEEFHHFQLKPKHRP